jgi:hypothetical protein
VSLDNHWVFGLTENFEEIIITNEIEPGEFGSLFFKVAVQSFLALI